MVRIAKTCLYVGGGVMMGPLGVLRLEGYIRLSMTNQRILLYTTEGANACTSTAKKYL
jgi:hypothetical protein